ncbi:MAG: FtsW/RodA/SpoVE family cell cycle protein [Armatimonadetes bacterium]|nr:FtsW/RodA/SpoVE family cell cycle protein [Armatimonadota bacterium]
MEDRMNRTWKWDPVLLWLGIASTIVGLLAIYDAGYARAAADGMVVPREFRSQLLASIVAVIGALGCWMVSKRNWRSLAWLGYGLTVVGLVVVKLIGTEINGAKRWIDLKVFTVQPAEFAKLFVILVLAAILAGRKQAPKPPRRPTHWAENLDWVWMPRIKRSWPLLLVLLAVGLIVIEPDLATGMVIVVVTGAMLFLGGVSRGSLVTLGVCCAVVVTLLVVEEPYRMERILHHGDRWSSDNIESIGYQTTQSEAAMANGGAFGLGLGEGRAKHTLPAPTTDFVLTTIAEETGLVGALAVLALMGGATWRLMVLARSADDRFGKLVLGGVASWIGVQACTNVVMANGFAPPIGVPMPFVSYGGSSLLALWMALGVCQSVLRPAAQEVTDEASSRDGRWHRRPRVSRA